ncbi:MULTISPECIES: hypothetical protein [Methylovorus]|jgi:hypothetical protein|uniref:hypothetical protein n=1 Tax=Methylovorus TaxID=81682 RepID=UPI001EE64513|nr:MULTISPECIES: hypothetical protein [Methylovorus]
MQSLVLPKPTISQHQKSQKDIMLIKFFILFAIPFVFTAFSAGLGWFANESDGAMLTGTTGFVVSAAWAFYSWATSPLHRRQPISRQSANRSPAATVKIARLKAC